MGLYDYVRRNDLTIVAVRSLGCWNVRIPNTALAYRSAPDEQTKFHKIRRSLPNALVGLFMLTGSYSVVRSNAVTVRGMTIEIPPPPRPANGSWDDEVQNLLYPRKEDTE